MKTLRITFVLCSAVLLTGGCAQPGGLFGPTLTPTPTITPSPTPTPSPGEILAGGWAALDQGDLEAAEEIADHILERDEENGEAWGLKGSVTRERGDIPNTAINLEKAYQLGYGDDGLKSDLRDAYQVILDSMIDHMYTTWDPEAIITDIVNARDILSRLDPLLDQAKQAYYQDILNSVLFDLDTLPEISNEAEELMLEGFDALRNEDFQLSNLKFQQVAELEPNYFYINFFLGTTEFSVGNHDQAVTHFLKGVESYPNDSTLWGFLGETYTQLNLPEHSREAFVRVLLLDIGDELAYVGLKNIYNHLDGWEYSLFKQFGFKMIYDPRMNLTTPSNLPDPTLQEGTFRMTGDILSYSMFWQQQAKNASGEYIEDLIGNVFELLGLTPLDEITQFTYGEVLILYQPYIRTEPSTNQNFNGVYAAWSCGNKIFTMDMFAEENDIMSQGLINNIALYLESFSCQVEETSQ